MEINSNFFDDKSCKSAKDKKLNLTDIITDKHRKNHPCSRNQIINYDYEKEKLEFFNNFNFENLYSLHRLYSKLIGNFEINNNFFQREKILNKIFEILNTKPYYHCHKVVKYIDNRALNKNLRIYFFVEITILALLYNSNISEFSDLYFAFKNCLFYLNQNLIMLTHFIIEKLEHIEKHLKKDVSFENFYYSSSANKQYKTITKNSTDGKDLINLEQGSQYVQNNLNNCFKANILDKEFAKKCILKLEENKTWLDKQYIFKNFNNNNKNIVNVCKNILGKLFNIPNTPDEIMLVYYEIKDVLFDFTKIKMEKYLEHYNNKVNKSNYYYCNFFILFG